VRRGRAGNVLTTLVFTDIVGSTLVAEELGDRRWRELLARHHRIVREALRDNGGRELDTTGDGVFARFDSPASAIRFAAAASAALRELGIEIRAGVHIGDCEVFDGKLSGVNVHVAARTMALAGAGEIFVTGSVRDLVRGGGFGFADRGTRELRVTAGEWRLFEVTSIDGAPMTPPLPEQEARTRRSRIVPPPLVKKRRVRLSAVAAAIALVLAGASFALADAVSGTSAVPLAGCELTSNPPLNDRAFNQAVFNGLTDAATRWNISVRDEVTNSSPPPFDEWKRHLNDLIRQRCGLIVTVGSGVGGATAAAAKANPGQRFAALDSPSVRGTSNLLSIVFRPEQAAFLAGYLAAGVTKTHTVGTFGGVPLPTVTPFMSGFAAGVLYYNRVHGTHIRLIGWNPMTSTGRFVGTAGAFADTTAASALTADLIHSGADVIFPVDGPGGETGSCDAARRTRGVLLIGVDTNQHFSAPDCEALWLTSVMKIYRRVVSLAMGQIVHHHFNGGLLQGTLANGGVGLAPPYILASSVPPRLQAELDRTKKEIINRSISLDPRSYLTG
jgi:basic membrane protein A